MSAIWHAPAPAQDVWGWSIIIPSVTGTDQLGTALRRHMDEPPSPRQSIAPVSPPALDALRYTPSKTRRAANLKSFIEKTRRIDPAGAQQLETLFASGDIIDRMDGLLRPRRFSVTDLADIYALWWIASWQALHGTNDETDAKTKEAVRQQAQRALIATPVLTGAGDATKQEMAESMLIQLLLIDAAVDQAKGKPEQMRAVGKAVAQGARGMGVDLSTITLTEAGFVPG
jgi:hypothetical protein